MGRLVIFNHMTLDGVMQAPGRPDEDRRGGFAHGGWGALHTDATMGGAAAEEMARGTALLLGRRTYEDFASFWPNQAAENPFTEVLNNTRKYVASRTLQEPLPWRNSTLLKGDAAVAVAGLKPSLDGDLVVLGSGELVQSLLRANLVDELILFIHPLILGSGRRLFPDGGVLTSLHLVDARPSPSGIIIATYRPVEPAKERTG